MRRARPYWARIALSKWKDYRFAFAIGSLPILLIFVLTRSKVFGAAQTALGTSAVLMLGFLLLAILTAVSIAALAYGFGTEDPLRHNSRRRRSARYRGVGEDTPATRKAPLSPGERIEPVASPMGDP